MKKKTMRLSRIKISQEMKEKMPKAEKISEKYDYYRNQTRINKKYDANRNAFKTDIVVDNHYVLQDGYINYLLAKMFGTKKIDVVIE